MSFFSLAPFRRDFITRYSLALAAGARGCGGELIYQKCRPARPERDAEFMAQLICRRIFLCNACTTQERLQATPPFHQTNNPFC